MEHHVTPLIALASVAVLGIGAQWLAWRIRLPSILLLLVAGLVAGPFTGWLDPDALLGDVLFPFVSLSVAVILFEGGLTLELGELTDIRPVLVRLVSVGVLVTWVLASVLAHWVTGLPWELAAVFGAVLTVTGPTVIGPLMRHVRPTGSVGAIAKWEGIVADVLGATLAVLVFQAIGGEHIAGTRSVALWGLPRTLLVGTVAGLAGALLLAVPLARHWVPDYLQSPVTLGVVLGVFTVCQSLQHESGLLAVTLMGFLLANQDVPPMNRVVRFPVRHIAQFKENLRVLLISTLFILLAARITPADLRATNTGILLFVALLILVVRPIAVLLSTIGTRLTLRERVFLSWMAPRGIVAAAVSALFALRLEDTYPEARLLAPFCFLVIIGTVAVYGLSAAPLARKLGLSSANAQGALIVGAGPFARELARTLTAEGVPVTLVDTNHAAVSQARLAGLSAFYGSVLDEDRDHELELGGLGHLLALTPNDEVNTLAAMHFAELFGRARVFQLCPRDARKNSTEIRGRDLFHPEAHFEELERRVLAGASVKRTHLTSEFDYEALQERYQGRALPLFRILADGSLQVFTAEDAPDAGPGDLLMSLVDPGDELPEDVEPTVSRASP